MERSWVEFGAGFGPVVEGLPAAGYRALAMQGVQRLVASEAQKAETFSQRDPTFVWENAEGIELKGEFGSIKVIFLQEWRKGMGWQVGRLN